MDITSYLLGKQAGGGSGVIGEEINITPSTSEQIITPSEGKNAITKATVSAVDNTIDNNIQAGNIKKDVNILGVTGTMESADGIINGDIIKKKVGSQSSTNQLRWSTSLNKIIINSIESSTNQRNDISYMFQYCFVPTVELTFSPKGTSCSYLFQNSGVKDIDLQKLIGTTLVSAACMFQNAIGFTGTLDLSFITNISGIYKWTNTFSNCSNITRLNISTWEIHEFVQGQTSMDYMFNDLSNLEELDMDKFDCSSYPTSQYFYGVGSKLPSGTYTKVYVKNQAMQDWILSLSSSQRPSGWSTANVIIAGSADDHRTD